MPRASASGSISQSVSGSVSAEGNPALWFIALVGLALLLLHLEGD
jgi:MYXO-CTERM domain-containing protein